MIANVKEIIPMNKMVCCHQYFYCINISISILLAMGGAHTSFSL